MGVNNGRASGKTQPPRARGAPAAPRRAVCGRFAGMALLLALAACGHLKNTPAPESAGKGPRAELSVGYTLLYQEADGLPKLKWLLLFKDKPEEMGQLTRELLDYYRQLADTLERLSKQYPGVHLDAHAMSGIEGEERKAIGEDMAKDFAPVIGKSGLEFEREALLMFYDTLNEQRHLVGVMLKLEKDPELQKFLETTKAQLDARHAKVGALLDRRYFTH